MDNSPQRLTWLSHAKSVTTKVNLAWWLQAFNVPLVILAIAMAASIMVARYYLALPSYTVVALSIAAILIITGYAAYRLSRKKFETQKDALVRIEDSMKLRNALTSAEAGVTPWPATPPNIHAGIRWHLPKAFCPTLLALIVVIASLFIPVGSIADTEKQQKAPENLTDLENKIELLEDDDVVQEDYTEKLKEDVEDLKEQDPADWYSHSSLEAIDNLKKSHEAAANNLEQNLNNAERTLQNLQKHGDKVNQATKESLLEEFGKAVENMDNGAMKPNKELLDKLKQLDPKKLGQLDQEQLDQLRKNMRNTAKKLGKQQGDQNGDGDDEDGDGDGEDEGEGKGEGEGDGEPKDGPGKGGIQRGPGHDPKARGKLMDELETGKHERIKPKDLSDTLPGDLLETTDGEHETDKTDATLRAGGASSHQGEGGDRVWKNSLLPNEKKALKNFFENTSEK